MRVPLGDGASAVTEIGSMEHARPISAARVLLVEPVPSDLYRMAHPLSALAGRLQMVFQEVWSIKKAVESLQQSHWDLCIYNGCTHPALARDFLIAIQEVSTRSHACGFLLVCREEDAALEELAIETGIDELLIWEELTPRRLARSLRFALRRQRTVARLTHQSFRDELTGLFNRRGFVRAYELLKARADAEGQRVLVLFADLDGLKSTNDLFGHEAGDRSLQAAARFLTSALRYRDVVARLGGDEFGAAALVHGTEDGDELIARLHADLREYQLHGDATHMASLSIGSALYNPENPQGLDVLLREADHRMYREKVQRTSAGEPEPGGVDRRAIRGEG
ncbi:MAG: GGDEF domain-containing protein [Sumerlaeia bacterium]